jgi:hypothetical protein
MLAAAANGDGVEVQRLIAAGAPVDVEDTVKFHAAHLGSKSLVSPLASPLVSQSLPFTLSIFRGFSAVTIQVILVGRGSKS